MEEETLLEEEGPFLEEERTLLEEELLLEENLLEILGFCQQHVFVSILPESAFPFQRM